MKSASNELKTSFKLVYYAVKFIFTSAVKVFNKIKEESVKNTQIAAEYNFKVFLAIFLFAAFDLSIRYFNVFNIDAVYDFFVDFFFWVSDVFYDLFFIPYRHAR